MTELHDMLEDSVNRVLQAELSWDVLRQTEQTCWSQNLWDELKDLGLPYLFLTEDNGGLDASWRDAYVALKACGRYAVPIPITEAIIANWYARQANIVLPENTWSIVREDLTTNNGTTVTFKELSVPWGRHAEHFLLVSKDNLKVVRLDSNNISKQENIGRDPRDLLSGAGEIINQGELNLTGDSVLYVGALQRSSQISGAASMALDLAVNYSADREQFGRPLSKFQTIQHYLSDLTGLVASVEAITLAACVALDEYGLEENSTNTFRAIAAAKCRASDSVEKISRLSHQVHGAIGFTYEYGLHYVTRRLWAWRTEFGSSNYWGSYLGDLAINAGDTGIWPLVTK